MCGLVPFGEELEDPYDVYQMIAVKQLEFPPYFMLRKNKVVKKLIEQLLNRSPDARLGGSYAALKAHTWFDNLDWDALVEGKLRTPFIPDKSEYASQNVVETTLKTAVPIRQEIAKNGNNFKSKGNNKSSVPGWDDEF